MDQKLLLPPYMPYSPTTVELKSPIGQFPTRLAPSLAAPFQTSEHRHDRSRGGLCRTVVLCILALAVCAGFVLLYFQMRDLQHQVQELQQQVEAGSDWQFDEYETPPEPWNRDTTQDSENHLDKTDSDGSTHHKKHTRERRSINGNHGNGAPRRRLYRPTHVGDPSAHVIPLALSQPQSHIYPASSWLVWTDQEGDSHASIPLRTNKFLMAPHAGYYYIYSQVTIETCNNNTEGRGHSLYVKRNCGRHVGKMLTYTQTSPTFNMLNRGCTYDSSYIGGVYYLEASDHVGVKPFLVPGRTESRLILTENNSYFGMIQLSKFERGTRGDCSLQIPQF